jgi:tetratricopeptide (TPR) repeat protein
MNPLFERARERGVDPKTLMMLERFEEQTALNPRDADAFAQMGSWWVGKRDYAAAMEHIDKALEYDSSNVNALRYRAKLRSTCPDAAYRDGEGALRDITRAMDIENADGRLNGDWLHRLYLRIRAAAHAELGQFDIAIATANEALDLSITRLAQDKVKRELAQYELGEPYRNTIC